MSRSCWLISLAAVMSILHASPSLAQRYTVVKSVHGTVLDQEGKPVANAEVSFPFTKQPVAKTKTDAEGKFSFQHGFGGSARLIVAISPDGSKQGIASLPAQVKDWNGDEVKVELKPAESVRVKVIDSQFKPIAKAKAGALIHYHDLGSYKIWGETNAEGDASWNIPAGTGEVSYFALKSGVGLDYVNYGSHKEAVAIPKKVTLQLEGATTFEVEVVDSNEKPLVDVRAFVWLIPKTGSSSHSRELFDLSSFADEICEHSDQNGKVRFDWLPAWGKHMTIFGDKAGYANGRLDARLDEEMPANRLIMNKTAKVAGRVWMPNGTPAKEVEVTLVGRNYDSDGVHIKVLTDNEGKFNLIAAPHHFCMIGAKAGKLVAQPIDGFVTHADKPIEGLELRLAPGIRVFGKVTKESDKLPQQGLSISLQQVGKEIDQFPGVTLPEPKNPQLPFRPGVAGRISEQVKTSAAGEYEFYTSPGRMTLSLRLTAPREQADELFEERELTTEKEYERDFLIPFNAEGR